MCALSPCPARTQRGQRHIRTAPRGDSLAPSSRHPVRRWAQQHHFTNEQTEASGGYQEPTKDSAAGPAEGTDPRTSDRTRGSIRGVQSFYSKNTKNQATAGPVQPVSYAVHLHTTVTGPDVREATSRPKSLFYLVLISLCHQERSDNRETTFHPSLQFWGPLRRLAHPSTRVPGQPHGWTPRQTFVAITSHRTGRCHVTEGRIPAHRVL